MPQPIIVEITFTLGGLRFFPYKIEVLQNDNHYKFANGRRCEPGDYWYTTEKFATSNIYTKIEDPLDILKGML